LVDLEGGKGNVSVLKLIVLSDALGLPAGRLLDGDGPDRGPRAMLYPRPNARARGERTKLVALVGLRGAGKSTIGNQVALRLGAPFIELDALIADRAGMSSGEIFDLHGAAYYRRFERAELERLVAEGSRAVVATAGSLVTDHQTYDYLLEQATVIWLKASAEDHHARVLAQGDTRPMLERSDAMEELRAILRARGPLYERAHHVVDTSKLGLSRAIDRVARIAARPPIC
jgi:XRE family aerobic/anaerobic benzoate catabolism transcriptional regulator